MSAPSLSSVAPEYRRMFRELMVVKECVKQRDSLVNRIVANRARYEDVANKLPNQIPWFGIALIHSMEGDLNFETHLHNGDSLRRRTVNVPAGRPLGAPPFTWEVSALDALRFDKWHTPWNWDLVGLLYKMEAFNGWGSRAHGVNTAYLWDGSQFFTKGKYIADRKWDGAETGDQIGAAVILHELCSRGIAVFKAEVVP